MTDEEQRALLQEWRPWIRRVASNMSNSHPSRIEELAQEGWIALWQASKTRTDTSWLKKAAMNRMLSTRRDWLAQCRDFRRTVPLGLPMVTKDIEGYEDDSLWAGLTCELGDIELAYHHGEIMHALSTLTPGERKYIYYKYWLGKTDTDMIEVFGYRPKTIGASAYSKLRNKLSHLRSEYELCGTATN